MTRSGSSGSGWKREISPNSSCAGARCSGSPSSGMPPMPGRPWRPRRSRCERPGGRPTSPPTSTLSARSDSKRYPWIGPCSCARRSITGRISARQRPTANGRTRITGWPGRMPGGTSPPRWSTSGSVRTTRSGSASACRFGSSTATRARSPGPRRRSRGSTRCERRPRCKCWPRWIQTSRPRPRPAAPAAVVRVVSTEYKTRVTTLETTGKVQFNEEQLVRITAPVTGRVVEVLARPGEGAEPGRRLLAIDSSDLGAAKSDYAKAVSDAERAEHAIDLARDLFEAKALAQKEVRAAENEYRKPLADLERAPSRPRTLALPETQLKAIRSHADASTLVVVRAPRSGTIVERNISPGQVVSYGQSDTPLTLFVIADLTTLWVLADLYEPDVPRVHLGQGVSVTLPCCPGDRYRGTVVNIGNAIAKDSRTLKVRAAVPNGRRPLNARMLVPVAVA